MTKAGMSLIFLLLFASVAAAQSTIDTLYYLPKSVVTISGTVTSKKAFTAGGLVETNEPGPATVALGVAADSSAFYYYRPDSKLLSRNTISIEMSPAGFISGVNGVSEGQAGIILKNVIGLVTGVAKIAAGGLFTATSPAEAAYEAEFAVEAGRRKKVKAALGSLLDSKIALQQKLVAEPDPKKREGLRTEIKDVDSALASLREEAQTLDAHFTAWKARKEDVRQQAYEWVLDADLLVPASSMNGTLEAIRADADPQMKEVIEKLRIVVALDAPSQAGPTPPTRGEHSDKVYHRVVVPSMLHVYRINVDDSLTLVKRSALHVVTKQSVIGTLPAPDSKWSKKTLQASFVDGALTKVAAEAGSELAGATDSLRALPGEYLAGIKQANEIAAEQRRLSLQSIDSRIEQVKKEKDLRELELAQQQIVDVSAAKASITELETQIKLLETQRAFNDAQSAAGDRSSIKLENDMTKLQIEQAELRRKLEALEKQIEQ